ncbi:head protein [Cystobacter fuscus]|nr:head protein [Cystobacter fuscus]
MRVQEFLGLAQGKAQSPEDKELLLTAIDALQFIWRNGQVYEFEEYSQDQDANAPARIIAAFDTLEEAQAWLKARPIPPDMAHVLIANEYHIVISSADRQKRYLPPSATLAYHIAEMTRDGLPPAVAHFTTREGAWDWFKAQAAPPLQSVIQIGGEHYLAVYYRNIQHRALFPFSVVDMLKRISPPAP